MKNDGRNTFENRVRVLIADDAAVIRSAVARFLEDEPSIKIVGQAESFSQTIEMATELKPDVILLDLHMPDSWRFEPAFIKNHLAHSGARVLGMSLSGGKDDEESQMLAESMGAVTLLAKGQLVQTLVPTIQRLHFCEHVPRARNNVNPTSLET